MTLTPDPEREKARKGSCIYYVWFWIPVDLLCVDHALTGTVSHKVSEERLHERRGFYITCWCTPLTLCNCERDNGQVSDQGPTALLDSVGMTWCKICPHSPTGGTIRHRGFIMKSWASMGHRRSNIAQGCQFGPQRQRPTGPSRMVPRHCLAYFCAQDFSSHNRENMGER